MILFKSRPKVCQEDDLLGPIQRVIDGFGYFIFELIDVRGRSQNATCEGWRKIAEANQAVLDCLLQPIRSDGVRKVDFAGVESMGRAGLSVNQSVL